MKTTMAEGGGGKDERNPFLFRQFFGDHTGEDANNDSSGTDDVVLPDVSNPQSKKSPRDRNQRDRRHEPEGQCNMKCKKSRGEDNPFSFKKFLQTGDTDGDAGPGHHIVTLDLANDLPDFVHNHQSVSTHRPKTTARSDCQLPDFTLDLQTRTRNDCDERLSLNNTSQTGSHSHSQRHHPGDVSVLGVNSNEDSVSSRQCHRLQGDVQLPDFTQGLSTVQSNSKCHSLTGDPHHRPPELHLSDPALELPDSCIGIVDNDVDRWSPAGEDSGGLHGHCLGDVPGGLGGQTGLSLPDFLLGYPGSVTTAEQNTHTEGEDDVIAETNAISKSEHTQQLQAENIQLRQELEEERETVRRQMTRLTEALDEVAMIRRREQEDTAALENMVQQVEANLITTTRRAVYAETCVKRLEEEVTSLQSRVQTLQYENDALQGGSSPTDHIKEQVKTASKQLSQAADQAEMTLQQLLTGVQAIKLVSTSLASIGKMSEVNTGQFDTVDDVTECGASSYSGT